MKTYTFEGKTKEAAVELALEELKQFITISVT